MTKIKNSFNLTKIRKKATMLMFNPFLACSVGQVSHNMNPGMNPHSSAIERSVPEREAQGGRNSKLPMCHL